MAVVEAVSLDATGARSAELPRVGRARPWLHPACDAPPWVLDALDCFLGKLVGKFVHLDVDGGTMDPSEAHPGPLIKLTFNQCLGLILGVFPCM